MSPDTTTLAVDERIVLSAEGSIFREWGTRWLGRAHRAQVKTEPYDSFERTMSGEWGSIPADERSRSSTPP
jgi:hypothetical protein